MAKLRKRNNTNEDSCKKMHAEMNMKVGPTRKEPPQSFPVYLMPDLDPMQKQINRIENETHHEARCNRRRAWRNTYRGNQIKNPRTKIRGKYHERTANNASCNTLEQLIPRLSASADNQAGRETFLRTALVSA